MSLAYFDTSALLKNYMRETGSARVRALLTSYKLLSSAITPIEPNRPSNGGSENVKSADQITILYFAGSERSLVLAVGRRKF